MADLLFERRGSIAWITFHRPERKNALSPEAFCRLADAWEEVRRNDDIRVAVLTGAGQASFTSGGDLRLLLPLWTGARAPEDEWDRRLLDEPAISQAALLKGEPIPKPIVAAVNGDAFGGGTELLLATDIRVAARHARFGLPEAQRGLVPGGGAMVRLARQVPWARAMEILLTGDPISADEALSLGLLNRVVDAGELVATVERYAERLARNGPLALQAIKRTAVETSGMPLDQAFAVEAREAARVMQSEDAREGPRAFSEKREPAYRGR